MQHLSALLRHPIRLSAIAAVVLGAMVLAYTLLGRADAAPDMQPQVMSSGLDEELEIVETADDAPAPVEQVIVYISGAVRAPDVYQLPAGARVKDLLIAAGGFADDADSDNVNLARPLVDGEHVHIPHYGEAPAAEAAEGSEAAPLININTASADELEALPGVGQVSAQRIVEYRAANGPFTSVEDLKKVKGIGPSLFAKIAELVTVGT